MIVNPADFMGVVDYTGLINQQPNLVSFFKGQNFFNINYTNQPTILFDKVQGTCTLLADTNRAGGPVNYGAGDTVSSYALPLSYHRVNDSITKQDFQGKRKAGTTDQAEVFTDVAAGKIRKARNSVDQTHEYMMLQAVKGICKTPQGTVLANMFTEFGVTQKTIDFDLGDPATVVDEKIAELKDHIGANLTTGGVLQGIDLIVDRQFFNKFKNHPSVIQAYLNSQSNVIYQQNLSSYKQWGVSDVFEFGGVRLIVLNHTFRLPNGTTEPAIEANTGYAIPLVSGATLFEGYYGPSQRLDVDGGAEMFMGDFMTDDKLAVQLMSETSALFICTNPSALVKATSSS